MVSMGRITFDLEDLRSYVTGIELGSFAKAAERLGRSTSAVSAHLKKLEQQAGAPILRKVGRGMVMTEAGETLLGYARRLLELNDEAAAAVRGWICRGRCGWACRRILVKPFCRRCWAALPAPTRRCALRRASPAMPN